MKYEIKNFKVYDNMNYIVSNSYDWQGIYRANLK